VPFVLVLVGLVLIVTAIRGTQGSLWNLIYGDITGQAGGNKGFVVWLAAIAAIGAVGYYPPLRTPSRLLLGLVVLGIFISNVGGTGSTKSGGTAGDIIGTVAKVAPFFL
jgi:hypothetical protein